MAPAGSQVLAEQWSAYAAARSVDWLLQGLPSGEPGRGASFRLVSERGSCCSSGQYR